MSGLRAVPSVASRFVILSRSVKPGCIDTKYWNHLQIVLSAPLLSCHYIPIPAQRRLYHVPKLFALIQSGTNGEPGGQDHQETIHDDGVFVVAHLFSWVTSENVTGDGRSEKECDRLAAYEKGVVGLANRASLKRSV